MERTPNQQSNPAFIVRHRIVKPRLDDELAAVEDARHRHRHRFPRRRSSAWRNANAMLANLTHPLVYAPGANMPQDDKSVIFEAPTKHATTAHAPRATWRQSHSRWVNRPHTFDNSWLAKWELANQTGRLHARARWAIRQNLLFGKKVGKCESVWRGGYNTLGHK